MILHQRHIKKVMREAKKAYQCGADTAFCPQGIIKPHDIIYRNTDIATPFLYSLKQQKQFDTYDSGMLYTTLQLIVKNKWSVRWQKLGQMKNYHFINIGAILKCRNVL